MNSHSVFFYNWIRPGSSRFQKKNIFSRFFEHHEHHFPVVLLNILTILMIFHLFWWDFPYTYGRGCHALSPFRQVLECTAACAQTQIGTPWTEMILGPKGLWCLPIFRTISGYSCENSCFELWFLSDLFDWIWLEKWLGWRCSTFFNYPNIAWILHGLGRMFSFVAVL